MGPVGVVNARKGPSATVKLQRCHEEVGGVEGVHKVWRKRGALTLPVDPSALVVQRNALDDGLDAGHVFGVGLHDPESERRLPAHRTTSFGDLLCGCCEPLHDGLGALENVADALESDRRDVARGFTDFARSELIGPSLPVLFAETICDLITCPDVRYTVHCRHNRLFDHLAIHLVDDKLCDLSFVLVKVRVSNVLLDVLHNLSADSCVGVRGLLARDKIHLLSSEVV
mmetsp:Transcript_27854/g.56066  ORF Transcript_27854/g.56066 Transcript_27854/m.56066 type:complete len:228 (-) Transcript_27854:102-785(-)